MSTTINYPFTTSGNYIFDAVKIEIVGGVAKLKDMTPANSTFGVTFTTDENGSFGDGVLSGTLGGAASIAAGKLICTGGNSDSCLFDGALNEDTTQVGAIKFKYTPAYTGTPAATRVMFVVNENGTNNNTIQLLHSSTSGNLQATIFSSTATQIVSGNIGVWAPTTGVEYEIEYNWDITTGASRLFIDGVQLGSTATGTGTRTSTTDEIWLGHNVGTTDASFADLVIFDAVQHTANYTAGYTLVESKYATDNPTVVTNTTFKSTDLISFATTEVASGLDAIKYTILAASQDRWVTGGVAANSDGTYVQSSTQAEITSDVANVITSRQSVSVKVFLHSDDGTTTPQADLITIVYNTTLADPIAVRLVEIEGFICTAGKIIAGLDVKVRPYLKGYFNNDIFHSYIWETIGTTDGEGFFNGYVYLQGNGKFWEFKIGSQKYKVTLLDQAEMNLKDAPTFELIS